jgi:hypothetical protein
MAVCIHIWEEHLTWYYSSVDYILKASSLWKLVMIGIIHHILYFYLKTFVTGRLKSNLLSPLKLTCTRCKYIILILFCLSTGWGEHEDAHGWLRIAEDVSGVWQNFIFYEIVHKTYFNSNIKQNSPFNSWQHSTIVSRRAVQWNVKAFTLNQWTICIESAAM